VDVALWVWGALLAGILAMLAVDLFMHRDAHVIGVREAAIWSGIWVAVAVAVGGLIWWAYGAEFGLQYFAGYVIEKSLAIDNVFVWAMIFSYFAVPRQYQHRVLFYGVLGALIFRAIFIAAGSVLIASFAWILYIFGAFLILTGIKMLVQRNEHIDPSKSKTLKLFRRFVPTSDDYDGQKFLTRRNGVLMATPLLAVLVLVEVTDIIFAVDSIPAIFAVTQEPFLVFASNALAILGLRAMYFLLADLMHRFIYLKLGLSLVLVWVGIKMIVSHAIFKIPTAISLGIVIGIIAISIAASLWVSRGKKASDPSTDAASEAADGTPVDVDEHPVDDTGNARTSGADVGSTAQGDSHPIDGRKDALQP
jgi:tellurite resistance protein TerC